MTWGSVVVGRLTLTEQQGPANEMTDPSSGLRTVALAGQESSPPSTAIVVNQRNQDLLAHPHSVVPVIFTDKADRSGYYRVSDSGSVFTNWQQETVTADWTVNLHRVGTEHEIDLESRLSGPQGRQNDFTVTGERIHVPPIGAYAYWAGTTVPTTMNRTTSDGVITVYRGIPLATHPRWACPLASYLNGRVRFLDTNGLERSGTDLSTTPTGWQLHNGLIRVRPSGTIIEVGAWDIGLATWSVKNYNIQLNGSNLGTPNAVTILRNEPEMVVVRLLWTASPGRTTADFTLRRGHRFTEVYVETQTSSTLKIVRGVTEAATAGTGFIAATANDTDGNRFWLASNRSFTSDLVNGAISKASTTTLGAAIGVVYDGSTAISGDTGTDLMNQFIGAPSERVEGVRR